MLNFMLPYYGDGTNSTPAGRNKNREKMMTGLKARIGANNEKVDILRDNMWVSEQENKAKMNINQENMEAAIRSGQEKRGPQ
jgi:hypothetical protein